jgi:SpoVK/Ycf46/Vps4 family AAA+-type ATPase
LEHLTEVLKIIDGGLRQDPSKLRRYVELLAEKLTEEGDADSAALLLKSVNGVQSRGLHPASFGANVSVPVDPESRLTVGELQRPALEQVPLVLSTSAQAALDEFISAYRQRDALLAAGLPGPGHLLLYGPPGCGKTQAAKYIAARLGLPLLTGRLDGLVSSFLGSTAKNIRSLFEYADGSPCILFLDEFDAIAKMRDDEHELGELKRVVNSLLQNIDLLPEGSSVLAATNHHHLLDPAVWRRFEFHIEIAAPDESARRTLISTYSPRVLDDRLLDVLTVLTENFTAAEIEGLVVYLARRAAMEDAGEPTLRRVVEALITYRARSTGVGREAPWPPQSNDLIRTWRELSPDIFTYDTIADAFGVSRGRISSVVKRQR